MYDLFKIPQTKILLYDFYKKKKSNYETGLSLYNKTIEKVKENKYLGLWLDEKYTWRKENERKNKVKKVLNLMRCISGMEWGAERESLLYEINFRLWLLDIQNCS